MLKSYILLILVMYIITGCRRETDTKKANIIDVGSEINTNNYKICNLSQFGNEIQYIPLETNEKSLIGKIGAIFFEDNYIYVKDEQQNVIHLFDSEGEYMGIIGNKGGGPDEYEGYIFSLDIIPERKQLSFTTTSFTQYIYTLTGEFKKSITLPKVGEEHFIINSLQLDENIFLCDLITTMQTKYNYLIYDDSLSKIKYIEEEVDPIPKNDHSYSTRDMALVWRYKDQLRYYKRMNNIIYSFHKNAQRDTVYTVGYGKYRSIKPGSSQDEIVESSIELQSAAETDKYIYLQFDFNKWAPQSIREEIRRPDGTTKIVTRNTVCAVYDKSSHTLQLLKHPRENSLGLYNDIDGGPPFWPQYIAASGEMVMCYSTERLMDIYNHTDNPSAKFTKLIQNINEESNPVLMLVQ